MASQIQATRKPARKRETAPDSPAVNAATWGKILRHFSRDGDE